MVPFGTRRTVDATWMRLDEQGMQLHDAIDSCPGPVPMRCPVVDGDGYAKRSKFK